MEAHPPSRSSRSTGSVLFGVKLSVEIRRDKRLLLLLATGIGRKDPATEIQLVKSSSNKYLAFCASMVKGASVINPHPESFNFVSMTRREEYSSQVVAILS